MPRRASGADRQVIEAAQLGGVDVTPSKLERWRDADLIPRTTQRSQGRGKGKSSSYSQADVDYIVAFAQLAVPRRPLWKIPLALFVRGVAVPETCLRVAYREFVDTMDGTLAKKTGSTDPMEQAEFVARELQERPQRDARRVRARRRATHRTLTEQEFFDEETTFAGFEESAIINQVLAVLAPELLAPGGVRELAADVHPAISAAVSEQGEEVPDVDEPGYLDDLHETFAAFTIDRFRDAVAHAPIDELRQSITFVSALDSSARSNDDTSIPNDIVLFGPLMFWVAMKRAAQLQARNPIDESIVEALDFEGENPS